MSAQNPFSATAQIAMAQALTAMNAAALLTGEAQQRKFSEFQELQRVSLELNRLEQRWQLGQMAEVVRGLEQMLRLEVLRESDIRGRLQRMLSDFTDGAEAWYEGRQDNLQQTAPIPVFPQPQPPFQGFIDPTKRHVDLALLHPAFRERLEKLIDNLAAASVPMKVLEGYRTPERQDYLFAIGRTRELHRSPVTFVSAWHSYHQYGLAVDMVIDHPAHGMWEIGNPTADGWWRAYHALASAQGLEPLSFEKPHVQLAGLRASQLLSGEVPGPGDETWYDNFATAVRRWTGGQKPPLPELERPAIVDAARAAGQVAAGTDWAALPRLQDFGWTSRFGGQEWRVDSDGIRLRAAPSAPQRTPGEPITVEAALELYAEEIAEASQRFGVPPELILMTIATETAAMRNQGFTGPTTFRWEAHVKLTTTNDAEVDGEVRGDYSAGPMQVLSNTAREVNVRQELGFDHGTDLKWFTSRPAKAPVKLGLYQGRTNIMLGTGYLHQQRGVTGLNPVLTAAAYNAGGLRASGTNLWGLHTHGDHLDRSSRWFGDACFVLGMFGRA